MREKQAIRYQLRYAAGIYWLLDMEQPGVPYKQPLTMNCVGADIWHMLIQGKDKEQIIEQLSIEYQADSCLIRQDTEVFLEQLRQYGVMSSEGEMI